AQRFQPSVVRHSEIEQKNVRLNLRRQFHRLEAVASFAHYLHILFRFQQTPQPVAKNGVIVGNHNAYGMSSLIHCWFIHCWPIHCWPIHDSPFSPAGSVLPAVRRDPESILSRVRPPAGVLFPGSPPAPCLTSPVRHPTAFRKKKI